MKYVKIGYYTTHPPFDRAPSLVIGAVGPVTIALQYAEVNSELIFCYIVIVHSLNRVCFSHFSTFAIPIISKHQCGQA